VSSYEPPDPTRPFLADLGSEDWQVVRAAVRRAGAWLRRGTSTEEEVSELGDRFVELAAPPKWEVRRAVALALEHLQHHSFQLAIAPLLEDAEHTVQQGAQRSLDRWTQAAHGDVLSDQHAAQLNRWLGEIETPHGKRTREAAMRLAERYAELLMREAVHELSGFFTSLDNSVTRMRSQLGKPRLDRRALDESLARHQERQKVLFAVVERLRDFTIYMQPRFQVVPLRPMVAAAMDAVRDRLGPDAERIAVELEIDSNLRLAADPVRLQQAFTNMVQNAVDSYDGMSGQRRVMVVAREEAGGRVVISFVDRGCGMTEEFRHLAFQLFRTTKLNGTGFGLAPVKKIVKNEHKGAVTLGSEKGKGTTVTVVLPIEQKEGRR
jgi:signal transduction histidine kinase